MRNIKRIIAEHEKSVKVLKKFKEDIEKLKHITDGQGHNIPDSVQ